LDVFDRFGDVDLYDPIGFRFRFREGALYSEVFHLGDLKQFVFLVFVGGIKEDISTRHSSERREVADKLLDCFTKGVKLDQGHILEDVWTVQGCQNDRGQFWRGRRGRRNCRDCWAFDGSGRAGESGKHITQSGHFWRFARGNYAPLNS
jgi:hypothetical protein